MKNPYETQRYLDEYLLFHFGGEGLCPFDFVPRSFLRFHERLRIEGIRSPSTKGPVRALDIGCAVGGFSFELTHVADEVLGIDNSRRFIEMARRLASGKSITVQTEASGRLAKRKVKPPAGVRKRNGHFEVGDALDLRRFCDEPFQIVAAINLLCRLPDPGKFLSSLRDVVAPGGRLILASPYSWLENYTPRRKWLSSAQVEKALRPDFQIDRHFDLPFLIREHERKYQLVISQVSTYIRR